jgi:glutamyl-tRNA reductase
MTDSRLYPALQKLVQAEGIEEIVILSTCNRTEFILWAEDLERAAASVFDYLGRQFGLQEKEKELFYKLAAADAVRHVFRVASGLDSMVVGEPEITGQVKAAWFKARQAGTSRTFLDAIFHKALSVAKRVRSETAIGQAAVSVPYAAVQLARQIFGDLKARTVLILGAGKMSELAVRYLVASGARAIRVVNRTYEHAVALATDLGGTAVPFEQREAHLAEADIVISSTGCPHFVLGVEDLQRVQQARRGRPLFLIDIAVPRDIHPDVRRLPGVFLYDLDDLEQVVARNRSERLAAAAQAETFIAKEVERFMETLRAVHVVPTIAAVRRRLDEIKAAELRRYCTENGPLAAEHERAVEAFAEQLVERIAGQLARELKAAAQQRRADALAEAVRHLFRLPPSSSLAVPATRHASLEGNP